MAWVEPLPQSLSDLLDAEAGEPVVVGVGTDYLSQGVFGEEWLIVTGKRVRIFTLGNGHAVGSRRGAPVARAPSSTPPRPRFEAPVASVEACRTDPGVGGGALEATIDGQSVELLRYSNARQKTFNRVSRYLDETAKHRKAVAKGETKEEPTIDEDKDGQKRCGKCRLPLPESTSVCPACVNKRQALMRVMRYLSPFRKEVTMITLMLVASTVLSMIAPYLSRPLMDVVLVPQKHILPMERRLFWLGVIVAGMLLSRALATVIGIMQGRASVRLTHWLSHSLRMELYQHLQRLSLRFFDKRQVGAIMSRVTGDTSELEQVLSTLAQYIVVPIFLLVGSAVTLCVMDWRLFLCVLVPVPAVWWIARLAQQRLMRSYARWSRARSRLWAAINDSLSGIRVVKAFAQEEREMSRFKPQSENVAESGLLVYLTWRTVRPFMSFVSGLGLLVVWFVGGRAVLAGTMTLGTLMVFNAFLGMLYGPIEQFSEFPQWFSQAMAAAERIFDILDTTADVPDVADPVRMPRIEGRVVFENLTFGYDPHKPVLKEVNLDVAAGEMIGLVGHSGAGKSTTINLLCRFYDPNSGRLLIDGVDARRITQKDLRSQIGLVLQDTFLFNGTIAENISYAKADATREEIIVAAKAANAHDFITSKPDGYDTQVGDRGGSLSGGERQRVAIARAILHDPRILILDEATSAVDTDTEKQIQDAIARLIKGRTTFAIAHRLSTLRNANRLVVLKGGKIEEMGTHDELMAKKGEFHRLVQIQQEMSKIKEVAR